MILLAGRRTMTYGEPYNQSDLEKYIYILIQEKSGQKNKLQRKYQKYKRLSPVCLLGVILYPVQWELERQLSSAISLIIVVGSSVDRTIAYTLVLWMVFMRLLVFSGLGRMQPLFLRAISLIFFLTGCVKKPKA